MRPMKRWLVYFAFAFAGAAPALAQAPPPSGTALRTALLRAVTHDYYAPRIAAFVANADALTQRMGALCAAPDDAKRDAARAAWLDVVLAWERANAVTWGPLLARRSIYRIDFWPVRKQQVALALRAPPTTLEGLDAIGGARKGLPLIEWMLWPPSDAPDPLRDPLRCDYAKLLAAGVQQEAKAIASEFASFAPYDQPPAGIDESFSELLNQALGGLVRLGLKNMENPATMNEGRLFPRSVSGNTVAGWNAEWSAMKAFLAGNGDGKLDNFDAYLRADGHATAADKLKAAVDAVSRSMAQTKTATVDDALRIARDVAELRAVLSNDVADALKIPVQFEETDGD